MAHRAGSNIGASTSGADGRIICTGQHGQGCRTLLVYPQGASNVRCALCSTVTQVPSSGADTAQLDCAGCRTRLAYARGAASVRCSVCETVNAARSGAGGGGASRCQCGGCGIQLMYAAGARSVMCAACAFVTQVDAGASHGGSRAPSSHPPGRKMVVVENPPTLDASGKMVSNMAVGVVAE